jgi:hypothetical protein
MNLTLEKILNIPIEGISKSINNIKNKQYRVIKEVGCTQINDKEYLLKTNKFIFDNEKKITENNSYIENKTVLEIPVLSLIRIPNINLENVEIEYDVEMMGCRNDKIYCINQPLPNNNFPNNLKFNILLESKNNK